MSDIRKLIESLDTIAGSNPEQKPGDQVRGTDKPEGTGKFLGRPYKRKEHPFKDRLVGEADESAEATVDLDAVLYALTSAYQKIMQSDAYSSMARNAIRTVYNLLRDPLRAGDEAGFNKMWNYASGRYPDAFDELCDDVASVYFNESDEDLAESLKKAFEDYVSNEKYDNDKLYPSKSKKPAADKKKEKAPKVVDPSSLSEDDNVDNASDEVVEADPAIPYDMHSKMKEKERNDFAAKWTMQDRMNTKKKADAAAVEFMSDLRANRASKATEENTFEDQFSAPKPPKKGTMKREIYDWDRANYVKDFAKGPHGKLKAGDSVAGPSGTSKVKEGQLEEGFDATEVDTKGRTRKEWTAQVHAKHPKALVVHPDDGKSYCVIPAPGPDAKRVYWIKDEGVFEASEKGFPHDVDHMGGATLRSGTGLPTACPHCNGYKYVYAGATKTPWINPGTKENPAKRIPCKACGATGFVGKQVKEGDVSEGNKHNKLMRKQSDVALGKEQMRKNPAKYQAGANPLKVGREQRKEGIGEGKSENRELWDRIKSRGTVPSIDRDRYTDMSGEGLEGPFRQKNGGVLYYDPKEGKYYNRDTDMYVDQADYDAMNEGRAAALAKLRNKFEDVQGKLKEAKRALANRSLKEAPIDQAVPAAPGQAATPAQQAPAPAGTATATAAPGQPTPPAAGQAGGAPVAPPPGTPVPATGTAANAATTPADQVRGLVQTLAQNPQAARQLGTKLNTVR